MSGNLGPQTSTKGETTSKTTTKTGYDRLDINKLYKKTAEPVAKTVTQKHGMQTLGKAPPARRAGASIVKPESTSNDTNTPSVPSTQHSQQQQQAPTSNLGHAISQQQKWANSTSHPPGPPSPMTIPSTHTTGHRGSDTGGNYQSQRFAQEFPSLDAGEPTKASSNSNQQHQSAPVPGLMTSSKSQDNQYGPGPILRPQTEGSWIQGGGRGGGRPTGPQNPAQNPVREQGPERPNLGGPTPPPMSLGQGGPAPPPLGAYSMQYRGMPPFMYPNGPPPGQGFFPPPGSGMPRYGIPGHPGGPPQRDSDNARDSNRGRGPPSRPTQQFAVKPILKQEDLKRMDEIDQEGTWASVRDDVDYNKRISFSDDEGEERQRDPTRKLSDNRSDKEIDRKPTRILERQPSSNNDREQQNRYDHSTNEQDNEDEWNKRRSNNVQDRGGRRGRDSRDEDSWRGGNNGRFDEDLRNRKGPSRTDPRGPQDSFGNKQYSNLPPRMLRQQQHNTQPPYPGNQRKTPSPVSSSGKDRDREYQRDREWDKERGQVTTQYRILERNRGDSESSNTSSRDKRSSHSEQDLRPFEKDPIKRSPSDISKDKDADAAKDKDVKGDAKKSEDSKVAFRTNKSGFTSSWAEEVEDDDYSNREYEDMKKYSPTVPIRPEAIKMEERPVPKRVYIQQRKVENMTAPKEPQPEQKQQTIEAPKQEKPTERPRPTAWGEREREARDKYRNDEMSQEDEDKEVPNRSTEREIILSDKAQQLMQQNKDESERPGDRKISHEVEKSPKDYEKREKERIDSDSGRERFSHKTDNRRDLGGYNNRDNRPRPGGRWGSNDVRRDNKTPERDGNAISSGRSSTTDTSVSSVNNKISPNDYELNRNSGIEKSRSGDIIKENSPSSLDKGSNVLEGTFKEKEGTKSNDYDRTRDRENNEKRYRNNDDGELDNRGNPKNNRGGRERSGHGVYQPNRGGWGTGRSEPRGRGRGTGRDHYDNRPRKTEYERDDHRNVTKQEREGDQKKEKLSEKDEEVHQRELAQNEDDRSKKEKEIGGSGEPSKKAVKSPQTNKRNINKSGVAGTGTRLQGYGAPSDTPPFSSLSSSKEEEKEKQADQTNKPSGTGPIPLMEIKGISPPEMPPRSVRHHNIGGRGSRGGGRGMQHPNESYSSYRGAGNKRGRGGDAKPLMSISSNDLERNELDTGSESGADEDSGKRNQSKGSKEQSSDSTHHRGIVDNSENFERDDHQQSDQGKKPTINTKEKSNQGSNSNSKNEKPQAQQPQSQSVNKEKKIRNPPYEAPRSATSKSEVPPRFQRQQQPQQGQQQQYSNSKASDGSNSSVTKDSNASSNAWDNKQSSNGGAKVDLNSQQTQQQTVNSNENKDSQNDSKISSIVNTGISSGISSSPILDGGPLKTMIFENRNFKSASVTTNSSTKPNSGGSVKINDAKKESTLPAGIELSKEIAHVFGKTVSEESSALDFASSFEEHSTTQTQVTQAVSSQHSAKPMPIGQSTRSYSSHLPSPISPLSLDLNEKIQSVRRVWGEPSSMPSVAEQTSVGGSDENSFHGGFGSDSHSLKSNDSNNREFSSSLQQPPSGYAPGSSPALSAMSVISKPESSTSPNASHMRQVKPQQQSAIESQNHGGGMSSSPFAYSMPQQHQGNAFGGMSAVPSPPTVMYGASQGMHSAGPHSGVYQTFPHVEASQVMNTQGRSFGQYSNPQGGGGGYGLGASIFMTSIETGYQPMSGFQQQHSHQQQHSQSGPQGQPPSQNNRISPGPLHTSSSGGAGSVGGVVMNSSSMKSQGGSGGHHASSMPHQHQVMPGAHNQQGYSQMNHHHSGGMSHHQQHAVGPVGPAKGSQYTQSGMANQSQPQLYMTFDPNQQSVINLGQNYMSSGMRTAPGPGGPPPSATPPSLQASSTYYSGNAANQVYHTGSNQGGNLQQLHVAVGPNPQALQNLQTATQQLGYQFQSHLNLQGYNQQAATTVSALNLGGQLIRPGPPGHSHFGLKQQGMDLVQQQMKSHDPMMNQSWNTQGFSVNQGFHTGNKPGGGNIDRNTGNNIGNQRKGSHQMGNIGGMKYVQNSGGVPGGGYPGHGGGQKGGRFSTPGPIQRPISTSTGPPIGPFNNSGIQPSSGPLNSI